MSVGIGLGDVCIALRGAFYLWAGVRAYPEDTRTVQEEISLWKCRLEELDQRVRDTKLSPGAAGIAKRDLLESFKTLEQIEKYLCSPTTKGSAHLKWAVYRRNKVMGYKENLNALMSRISEMTITENVHHQAIMVPKNNLVITLPTQFKEEPVYLVDAMDEMVIFSAAFCRDFESLHTLIGLRFKHSKVASWMEQRRYEITNEDTGARLGSDIHGNIVKPGMRLSMAMLLFLEKKSTKEAQHECPRCGKGYEGATSGVLERVQCEKCRTIFQVSIEPRIIEIDDTDTNTPPSGGLLEDENTSKCQTVGLTDVNHRDIELFRRLHVLLRELDEIAELGPISEPPERLTTHHLGSVGGSAQYCSTCGFGPHNGEPHPSCLESLRFFPSVSISYDELDNYQPYYDEADELGHDIGSRPASGYHYSATGDHSDVGGANRQSAYGGVVGRVKSALGMIEEYSEMDLPLTEATPIRSSPIRSSPASSRKTYKEMYREFMRGKRR